MRGVVVGNRDFGKTGPPQLRPVFPAIKAERRAKGKIGRRGIARKRERVDEGIRRSSSRCTVSWSKSVVRARYGREHNARGGLHTRSEKRTGRVGRGVGKGGSRHFSWPRAEICVHRRN